MQYNREQQTAVEHMAGPMLVLSGAGTGKTRVVVGRIVCLIANGVSPSGILAITFTRKAAEEMKQRLASTQTRGADAVTVCTFHALCLRLLRQYALEAGLSRDFSLLDEGGKMRILSAILRQMQLEQTVSASDISTLLSAYKNRLQSADEWETRELSLSADNERRKRLIRAQAEVFRLYEAKKAEIGSLDFDDLLVRFYTLLYEDKSVRSACQKRFTHVLVDEYQDTNVVQYRIAHMLTQHSRNLCVVGDDDQSIYSWRGAEVENILSFPDIFKDCAVVKLEQNYRSTRSILAAAHAVIQNNTRRMEKTLWTENEKGEKPHSFAEETAVSECRKVALLMEKLRETGMAYRDMAVLYRRNSASAVMEEALAARHIPCVVAKDSGVFDLYEIRVLLRRMEEAENPLLPMQQLEKLAADMGYFRKMRELEEAEAEFPPWIDAVSMLIDSATEYFAVRKSATLTDFARHIRSISQNRAEKGEDAVNLLTLHGAKGLEFRAVFMIQLADDIIPGRNEGAKEEEERRLFYVGMTRAKELLYLSYSRHFSRDTRHTGAKEPSRFLREIPSALLYAKDTPKDVPGTKPPKPEREDSRFAKGDRVKHPRFGKGVVAEITTLWVKVRFDDGTERKFLRHFLEKQR